MKIKAENISAGYGGKTVIEKLSLSIPEGGILTLIGANGSGKSTILKTLSRMLAPTYGTIYLDGRELHSYSGGQFARKLAMLSQSNSAPDDLIVEDLVSFGRFPHRRFLRGMSGKDREVIEKVLLLTQLEQLRERLVVTLSGGERQRAWLALTLAQEPEVLLLDEPTTYLDVSHQFDIIELIMKMNRELGITIVMVLHDLNLAARSSHRMAAVKDRKIYREGSVREIMTEEVLKEVFNIKARIIYEDGIPHFLPLASFNAVSQVMLSNKKT